MTARARVDAPEGRRADRVPGPGCRNNHMAPSITTVAVGLDSLWLSTRGELDASVLEALAGAKAQASEQKQPIALELETLGQFGGIPLYVRPFGGGGYAYLAFNEWGEFAVSAARPYTKNGKPNGKPTIRGRLSSDYLHDAPSRSITEMQSWLSGAVPGAGGRAQVSEAHYHVDLAGWEPAADSVWVCPVLEETRRTYYCSCGCNRQRLSSVRFGEKDTASLQLIAYDKRREMGKMGRADPILEHLWRANSWDGEAGVFRVEARYQRGFLRERGVDDINELRSIRDGLWAAATRWAREVSVGADSHRERWPLTPAWEVVHSQVFRDAVPAPKVSRDKSADATQLLKQSVGTLAAAVARLRAGGADWNQAWKILYGDGEVGYSAREVVARFAETSARKSRELGISPLVETAA